MLLSHTAPVSPAQSHRIGIVGIGFGQSVLLPAFRNDPRVEVTAIAATSHERAQAVATRSAIPDAFGDWRALIEGAPIDAVAVAVPPVLQPDVVAAAIARGKHVFCEKPVALEVERAQALLAQANRAGVVHAVDFEFRELAAWKRAHAILAAGELGAVRGFALTWHVLTRAQQLGTVSWKTRAEAGGGALSNFASHTLHLLEWLLGPIARLSARLSPPDAPADTRVAALVELASGAAGTISVATDALAAAGHRLEIWGSEAALLLDNASGDHFRNFVLTRATRGGQREILVDERGGSDEGDGRLAPVSALVRNFVDAVDAGVPTRPHLEDGLRVAVLMDAVRKSDRSGTWLSV